MGLGLTYQYLGIDSVRTQPAAVDPEHLWPHVLMANPEGDEGRAEGETSDGTADAPVAVCADATPATHRGLADGDSAHGMTSSRRSGAERPKISTAHASSHDFAGSERWTPSWVASGEWLPLVRHTTMCHGDSLDRHFAVTRSRVFQVETWRMFVSKYSPLSAVFSLNWARLLAIIIGMWVLIRTPSGILRGTWMQHVPASAMRNARAFRFTAFELRKGTGNDNIKHGLTDFGPLCDGFKVGGGALIDPNSSQAVISFDEDVTYNGWYMVTSGESSDFDPSLYTLEASPNGQDWLLVASSWNYCGCGFAEGLESYRAGNTVLADIESFKTWPQVALPEARGAEKRVSFTTFACLWPYYLMAAAEGVKGLTLVMAAVLAVVSTRQGLPVKCWTLGAIICYFMYLLSAIQIARSPGTEGLLAHFGWSMFSLLSEALLSIFVFPGPALFTEQFAVELALIWGVLVGSANLFTGTTPVVSPVLFVTCSCLLILRQRRRYTANKAVAGDTRAFDAVWRTICQESQAADDMQWLAEFEDQIAIQFPSPPRQHSVESVRQNRGRRFSEPRNGSFDLVRNSIDLVSGPLDTGGNNEDGDEIQVDDSPEKFASGTRWQHIIGKAAPQLVNSVLAQERETPVTSLDQLYAQAVVLDPLLRAKTQQLAHQYGGLFFVRMQDGPVQGEGPIANSYEPVERSSLSDSIDFIAKREHRPGSDIPAAAVERSANCVLSENGCRLVPWVQIQQDETLMAGVQWGQIKRLDRAVQKIIMNYEGRPSHLLDLVRQRIVFDSLHDIRACLAAISNDPDLSIVRVRNRLNASYDGHATAGYRDVVLAVRMQTQATMALGVNGHVMELQLAHRGMASLLHPSQHERFVQFKAVMQFQDWPRHNKENRIQILVESQTRREAEKSTLTQDLEAAVGRGFRVRPVSGMHGENASEPSAESAGTQQPETIIEAPDTSGIELRAGHVTDAPTLKSTKGEAEDVLMKGISQRAVAMMRWRCCFDGSILRSRSDQANTALQKADASALLFARPLWSLSKGPVRLVLAAATAYYCWSTIDSPYSEDITFGFHARHLRLTVLETRDPAKPAGDAKIGGIDIDQLGQHGELHRHLRNIDLHRSNGTHHFVSYAEPIWSNSWSLTTSEDDEDFDPVRFLVHVSNPPGLRKDEGLPATNGLTLADCLVENDWCTLAEANAMPLAEQRKLLVEKLRKRGKFWCSLREEEAEVGGVCRGIDGMEMSDEQLISLSTPPWLVPEEFWELLSASVCRHGVYDLRCLPKPDQVAKITTERGIRHHFYLSPKWYVVVGVYVVYWPIVFGCGFAFIAGSLGDLNVSKWWLASVYWLPGILELITAAGLTFDSDPFVNPWDSFYWWFLASTSIWVGWTMLFDQHNLMRMAPWPFLICLPMLNIHNLLIIGGEGFSFPFSHLILLCFCAIFTGLRELLLFRSFKEMKDDYDAYQRAWSSLNSNPSDAAALTDLEVFCASHFRKRRPKQVMSNVLLSAQDSSASRAVQEGQALPFETHSLRNQLGTSFGHVADLIMLPDAAIQVLFGTSFGRQKLDSLDTLYMQAIMLEPIFLCKMLEIGQRCSCPSSLALVQPFSAEAVGSAPNGDCDVFAESSPSAFSLIKSVDRAVQKLARVYQSQACMLLDVVRDCIVVDTIAQMHQIMRDISEDKDIRVLRVQNRMSKGYDPRASCGYRDVMVNLCINTPLTHQLGLSRHVCELQIILKTFMVLKSQDGHKRYVKFRDKRVE